MSRFFCARQERCLQILRIVLFSTLFLSFGSAPSFSQLTPVGSSETFDFATWNIEWFGSGSNGPADFNKQRENVRAIIEQSGIEFWALQEISETFQFNRLVDSLGTNWVGHLATISGQQRIAFLYNTDVVRQGTPVHILKSDDQLHEFAQRAPLRLTVDVMMPDTTITITFITVHMKCCGGVNDRNRREAASSWLKIHMDFALAPDQPIVLLGDLNDELRFSITNGQPTPYQNFLDDPTHYSFASTRIDTDREYTWCRNSLCSFGSTLDHILISNELFNKLIDNRAYRLFSVIDADPGFVNETSDHLPVYARLVFSTATATEEFAETPGGFRILSAFPNPANNVLNIELSGIVGRPVTGVEIFDILGRKVELPSTGPGTSSVMQLDTSRLAPGLYLLRLSNGQKTDTVRFIRER